jgi:hypothetical protein
MFFHNAILILLVAGTGVALQPVVTLSSYLNQLAKPGSTTKWAPANGYAPKASWKTSSPPSPSYSPPPSFAPPVAAPAASGMSAYDLQFAAMMAAAAKASATAPSAPAPAPTAKAAAASNVDYMKALGSGAQAKPGRFSAFGRKPKTVEDKGFLASLSKGPSLSSSFSPAPASPSYSASSKPAAAGPSSGMSAYDQQFAAMAAAAAKAAAPSASSPAPATAGLDYMKGLGSGATAKPGRYSAFGSKPKVVQDKGFLASLSQGPAAPVPSYSSPPANNYSAPKADSYEQQYAAMLAKAQAPQSYSSPAPSAPAPAYSYSSKASAPRTSFAPGSGRKPQAARSGIGNYLEGL